MSDFVAKPPDFSVSAISKATQVKGTVGVGWTQPDGTIRIKLNSFVVLNSADDLVITLFPKQDNSNSDSPTGRKSGSKPTKGKEYYKQPEYDKHLLGDDDAPQPF